MALHRLLSSRPLAAPRRAPPRSRSGTRCATRCRARPAGPGRIRRLARRHAQEACHHERRQPAHERSVRDRHCDDRSAAPLLPHRENAVRRLLQHAAHDPERAGDDLLRDGARAVLAAVAEDADLVADGEVGERGRSRVGEAERAGRVAAEDDAGRRGVDHDRGLTGGDRRRRTGRRPRAGDEDACGGIELHDDAGRAAPAPLLALLLLRRAHVRARHHDDAAGAQRASVLQGTLAQDPIALRDLLGPRRLGTGERRRAGPRAQEHGGRVEEDGDLRPFVAADTKGRLSAGRRHRDDLAHHRSRGDADDRQDPREEDSSEEHHSPRISSAEQTASAS